VSDSALDGNTLTTVYQGSDGLIRYATATYDPASKSWSPFTVSKLPRASADIRAMNPSFTVDANGNTWVAYVAEDTRTPLPASWCTAGPRQTNWAAASIGDISAIRQPTLCSPSTAPDW
jgi:hypothetical protein